VVFRNVGNISIGTGLTAVSSIPPKTAVTEKRKIPVCIPVFFPAAGTQISGRYLSHAQAGISP
jgi:hypothetical protein